MKIFELYCDCDLVYATRSESLVYRAGLKSDKCPKWIVEIELDTMPVRERVYNTLVEFRKEYNL